MGVFEILNKNKTTENTNEQQMDKFFQQMAL